MQTGIPAHDMRTTHYYSKFAAVSKEETEYIFKKRGKLIQKNAKGRVCDDLSL